ncbi:amidohydrolase family protein [Aureimonas sp. ME7]|uniref:amidohydrolase family protein n=1 Tax=Aureimonas sp. ME7 TaxID=2744252 RepID=UPI0015F5A28B|nr:amidohydrolase family protein [Aureimonas sp. ME7]
MTTYASGASTAPATSRAMPRHACDTHFHVFDDRFPRPPGAVVNPPPATASDYLGFAVTMGIECGVVVQPSTYGTDNACLLDALGKLGPSFRGVAVVDLDVTDDELARFHRGGVRGVRFNTRRPGPLTLRMAEPLAQRIAPLGWHIQLHVGAEEITAYADVLAGLPVPVVFDHLGGVDPRGSCGKAAIAVVCKLLERRRAYVKISGLYHVTRVGPPGYEDAGELARRYAAIAPDRLLFGTDWPHPSPGPFGLPSDPLMLERTIDFAGEAWRTMLVDNPERLYGFGQAR